jgi:hypothetical protein
VPQKPGEGRQISDALRDKLAKSFKYEEEQRKKFLQDVEQSDNK